MKSVFKSVTTIFVLLTSSSVYANSALFSLVTIFSYPKDSGNYVQVQSKNQMTRQDCETQIFLLSDNKCQTIYWKTGHSHIKRKVNTERA